VRRVYSKCYFFLIIANNVIISENSPGVSRQLELSQKKHEKEYWIKWDYQIADYIQFKDLIEEKHKHS
jgi:hypothetical protein